MGLYVLHHCDTPLCVNPAHLFTGTAKDNAQDAKNKGRQAFGSKNGNAKLDDSRVKQIKKLKGVSSYVVGASFGVSASTIQLIRKGIRWAHVSAD